MTPAQRPILLRARWIACSPERVLEDASLVIRGGRIEQVAARRLRVAGARELDLGDAILAAGMVNAHAHLELGAVAGRTPRGADFAAWVRTVIALRGAASRAQLVRAARSGATRALETGTTVVTPLR